MIHTTRTTDGIMIAYDESGTQSVALVFVHGWLGNANWWLEQKHYFKDHFKIIRMDLGGHGRSERHRKNWTHSQYAEDIVAVIDAINAEKVILIGHSMAGAYVLEAAIQSSKVQAIILVDTLKNLDQVFSLEQAEQSIFKQYRDDFKYAVEHVLPKYLYAQGTPQDIQIKLAQEFLSFPVESAIDMLRPLYQMDVRSVAKKLSIPVRAINSDFSPTFVENNQKYFQNYNVQEIRGAGHYPMLEQPEQFNRILEQVLVELFKSK